MNKPAWCWLPWLPATISDREHYGVGVGIGGTGYEVNTPLRASPINFP